MSKAFTKEDDEASGDDPLPPYEVPLPPDARNYITPKGAARLRSERDEVLAVIRATRADPTRRDELRAARRREQIIDAHLDLAEEVAPPIGRCERVTFGTRVRVRDESGSLRIFEIVGIDEADAQRRRVSWRSPIARALAGARAGEGVTFASPRGEETLEVVAIDGLGDTE